MSKLPLRGVLFDLDGTVLDTMELISRSFHHAMVEVLGSDQSMELFCETLGQPLATQMALYCDDEQTLQAILDSYRVHNHAIEREAIRIFEGMQECLQSLRSEGYLLGIATSKRHNTAASNLDVFGLLPLFGSLVACDDVEFAKPDPQSVVLAAQRLGLRPQECLYVGDSPYDMQAGNAAGAVSVAALWGQHPRERLLEAKPAYACETIYDLVELVHSYGS